MNLEQIQSDLCQIFGFKVQVYISEGTLIVNQLEPYYSQLLYQSKPPAKISAEWIINRIQKKQKQSEDMKARREKIVAEMRKYLAEKGIKDFSTYETTFGFSVCNLFQDGIKYAREVVEKCGIEYKKIEYSPEHWVVRVYV